MDVKVKSLRIGDRIEPGRWFVGGFGGGSGGFERGFDVETLLLN